MLTVLDRLTFKGAFRLDLKVAGGPEKAPYISGRVARAQSFQEYGDPNRDDRQPAWDVVVEVDQANGNFNLISAMARMLGAIVVKAPTVTPAHNDIEALLGSAKESADAISAGWAARADGQITDEERAKIVAHLDRAVSAFEAYRAFLNAESGS